LADEIGALRMNPGIDVLPVIAIRPSIESAVLHRGQVVRHEVGDDLVAFVDDCPQSMALRFPSSARLGCAGRLRRCHLPVAQSTSQMAARFFSASIPFSVMLLFEPDADIQQRSILARDEALRPVMVNGTTRQLGERGSLPGDCRIALLVVVANDGVGIRDIKIVAHKRHAEGESR